MLRDAQKYAEMMGGDAGGEMLGEKCWGGNAVGDAVGVTRIIPDMEEVALCHQDFF